MYTIEVYQADLRFKAGEHMINKIDREFSNAEEALAWAQNLYKDPGRTYRFEIWDTYVVRKNLMTGEEFKERYDTPYSCSPSSETYWSA